MVTFIEMTFAGGAREVKRIVVRSAIDTSVDKLKEGKFTLYKGSETAEMDFLLESENVCAVHINFANANDATKAIAMETSKIRLDILSQYRETKLRTGFKLDIFVNELTLAEAPTSGNSTTSR